MTVRPTQPGQASSSRLPRTGKAAASDAARAPRAPLPATPAGQAGPLASSAEARNLEQPGGAPQETTSELSADRMREVIKRMKDRHYEKPEVMDEVIRRMVKDL